MGETLRIDVSKVLEAKMPKKHRYIPRCVVKWLERIIHQDELNHLLLKNHDKTGVDFADAVLTDLGIKTNVVGGENLPANGSGRYIFVSNHPLGGLDGMALIALLGHHYDKHLKFIVNDMLMQVVPLRDVFLPANKVGRQSHEVAKCINEAMAGNGQIATYMTKEECRLSIGPPDNLERIPTYNGVREYWYYSNGTYLIFDEEGLLTTFRR